jgi:hypothetical protein
MCLLNPDPYVQLLPVQVPERENVPSRSALACNQPSAFPFAPSSISIVASFDPLPNVTLSIYMV